MRPAGEKYGFDVKPRKAEIKALAVEFCNQRFEAEGPPKEEEAAGEAGEAEQAAAVEEPEQHEDAAAEGAAEEVEEQPEVGMTGEKWV